MRNVRIPRSLAALALAAVVACGEGPPEEGRSAAGDETADQASGIPVEAPSGPVDQALAERGESLYMQKGCVGCHTIGKGRLTGPDFAEVESWKDFEWFYHMVTNPDSMTRNDPTAKRLLQEYMTPMPDLNVQPDEVRALYEYIRHESAETDEEGAESESQGSGTTEPVTDGGEG